MKITKGQLRQIVRNGITESLKDLAPAVPAVVSWTMANVQMETDDSDLDEDDDELEESMKVTKRQLKRIIREERAKLKETSGDLTTDYAVSKMTEEEEEVEEIAGLVVAKALTDGDEEELEEARLRRRLRSRLRKANLTERLLMETMIEWEAYPEVGDAAFDFSEELTELIVALGARTRGWSHSHVDRVVTDHLFSAMSDIAAELGLSYED